MRHYATLAQRYASNVLMRDAARAEVDPTNTHRQRTLGKRYIDAALNNLKRSVRSAVITQDAFGAGGPNLTPTGWTFSVMAQAFDQASVFHGMFKTMVDSTLMTTAPKYLKAIVASGYNAGLEHGRGYFPDAKVSPLQMRESMAMVQSAVDQELQGIADALVQQCARTARTMLTVKSGSMPLYLKVTKVIDTMATTRLRAMVSQTVVHAHAMASLDVFDAAGVEQVGCIPEAIPTGFLVRDARAKIVASKKKKKRVRGNVGGPGSRLTGAPSASTLRRIRAVQGRLERNQRVNVLTAGDNDVCEVCEDIADNGPYTINRARNLIPAHPHCRCVFVPTGTNDAGIVIFLDRFDPNQPRAPKGSDKGGQWVANPGYEFDLDADYYFHGTTDEVVESIMKTGLRPDQAGTGADVWLRQKWPSMYKEKIGEYNQYVYLAREREQAERYIAMRQEVNPGSKGVVFTVRVPRDVVRKAFRPDKMAGGTTIRSAKTIPPEWIKGHKIYDAGLGELSPREFVFYAVVMVDERMTRDGRKKTPVTSPHPDKFVWEKGDVVQPRKTDDYDPNQARAPKGSDIGGQWVASGEREFADPDDLRAMMEESGEEEDLIDDTVALEGLRERSLSEPLTDEEELALGFYSDGGYAYVNDVLRHGEYRGDDARVERMGKTAMDGSIAALDKASLAEDMTVYRIVSGSFAKTIKDGEFTDKGFVSTSAKDLGDEFGAVIAALDETGEYKTIKIKAPKGARAMPVGRLSNNKQEREVLFAPGSTFRVSRDSAGNLSMDYVKKKRPHG